MKLILSDVDRGLIEQADKEVFLGIITVGGQVRVQVSDPKQVPGHVDWMTRDSIGDATRGFSVIVHRGKVTALMPYSCLNPGEDPCLEDEYIQALLRLLPAIEAVRVVE